jgi:hypothetical protein
MREGTHAARQPEDLVALLPVPDRRAQNLRLRAVVALRRRRPDVRDDPRELDAEDLARALRYWALLAPLLSSTLHGEHAPGYMPLRCMMSIRFRPNARILTSTWPGPGAGYGVSPRKSAPASPLPSRTITERIVWAEGNMIMGDCVVCSRCENVFLDVPSYDPAAPRSLLEPSWLRQPAVNEQEKENQIIEAKRQTEYVQDAGLELWSGLPKLVLRHRNYRLARSRASHAWIEPGMQAQRQRKPTECVMKRIRRRCGWVGRCETCELRRDGRVGGTSDALQTPCGPSSE